MPRITKITASLLAVAALAPAGAIAADNALRGAPQMYRLDDETVQVRFGTDQKVGRNDVKVAVSDAGLTRTVKSDGRHGNDHRYVARVNVDRDLEVGSKYTVRFTIDDDASISRKVVLRTRSAPAARPAPARSRSGRRRRGRRERLRQLRAAADVQLGIRSSAFGTFPQAIRSGPCSTHHGQLEGTTSCHADPSRGSQRQRSPSPPPPRRSPWPPTWSSRVRRR